MRLLFPLVFGCAFLNLGCQKALKDEKVAAGKEADAKDDKVGAAKDDKTKDAPEKKSKGKSAAPTLTAEKLMADMKAGKKIAGPTAVEGIVESIDLQDDGRASVTLKAGPGSMDLIVGVTADKSPWDTVVIGQKAKLTGTFESIDDRILFNDVSVAFVGGKKAVVKSEDLAAENTNDNEATKKKYNGLVVTGTVLEIEDGAVTLKDDGKTKIVARFEGATAKMVEKIKAGDSIRINAKLTPTSVTPEQIVLTNPLLMSK